MLTRDQIDHFETFGFLLCRQIFTTEEIDHIKAEAESVFAALSAQGGQTTDNVIWQDSFIERNPDLLKLIEDDRIYLAIQDLIGDCFIYLGSEGMRGLDRGGPVHHWHADGEWALEKLDYKRIKIMLYLDSLHKDNGALRLIPGSHRLPMHEALRPFYEAHTMENPTFFGMDGADIPAYVVETEPGDMVIFNQWVYHAVYGNVGGRRNIVLRFADCDVPELDMNVLGRSPKVFTPHEVLQRSDSPRIQHMIARLMEVGEKVAQAEE